MPEHSRFYLKNETLYDDGPIVLEKGTYYIECCGENTKISNRSAGLVSGKITISSDVTAYALVKWGVSSGGSGVDDSNSHTFNWGSSSYYTTPYESTTPKENVYAVPGEPGGLATFFYIPSWTTNPLMAASGAGGNGSEGNSSQYQDRIGNGLAGGSSNGGQGSGYSEQYYGYSDSWPTENYSRYKTFYAYGGRTNGSSQPTNTYGEIYDTSGSTMCCGAGGGGGAGWPGGNGGNSGFLIGRASGTKTVNKVKRYGTTVYSGDYGYNGGTASTSSTSVKINGTTYSLKYGRGGNGGSAYLKSNMSDFSNGTGGGGGMNYIDSRFTDITNSRKSCTTPYVKIQQWVYLNYVVVTPVHCSTMYSSEVEPLDNPISIYLSDIEYGYTLKAITISGSTISTVVYTNTGSNLDSPSSERYEVEYNVTVQDTDIYVTNSVYVNPTVTVRYMNSYTVSSHVLSESRPEIFSRFGLSNIEMLNGWKYKQCILSDDDTGEELAVVTGVFNSEMFYCDPSYEGRNLVITIQYIEDQIPVHIIYNVLNKYANNGNGVYERRWTDTIYGTYVGQRLLYDVKLESFEGYTCLNPQMAMTVRETGTVTPIYLEPLQYTLAAIYGIVQSEELGKGFYTEKIIIDFDENAYDGDPRDEFIEWSNDAGYIIPDNKSKHLDFSMPHLNLVVYPIMKPYRKNSNIYRNMYDLDKVIADNLIANYNHNIVYDGDIIQANHGFSVGDAVYRNPVDGKFRKAIADGTNKSVVYGIVTNVNSENSFGLQTEGKTQIKTEWSNDRSSVMYLSDVDPGKLVQYNEISGNIHIPVAVWTNEGIIVCVTVGSAGADMKPYVDKLDGPVGTPYSIEELDSIINEVLGGI